MIASILNSCMYRLVLIDTPSAAVNHGCKVARKAGAIQASRLGATGAATQVPVVCGAHTACELRSGR